MLQCPRHLQYFKAIPTATTDHPGSFATVPWDCLLLRNSTEAWDNSQAKKSRVDEKFKSSPQATFYSSLDAGSGLVRPN